MTTERRNLTNEEREAILREVLLHSNGSYLSRLPKGLSQELTVKYSCHVATIRRVLAVAKQQGVPHMSKRKEERRGLLPQNVTCPRDFFDAARAKLDGMASSELDRVLAAELKEARCADELAQVLEAIIVAIALSDDESDDMISAMAEVGIDPVWKMTSMRSYMYACWYCGWSLCSLGGFLR
ncbi:hypothetical protein B5M09_011407 [Aphanomyces astaci]|uniref:Uncharacterized protein n=1 Tax=Aphanomyces astaci TaxID=112090 RepID=A0A3R7XPA5_APHAT|nr:hypothetical protein B5M09_011407 [Aphanomyces astaci]